MYNVSVQVQGISPLMQHAYPMPKFEDMGKGGKRVSGSNAQAYLEEWREYFYTDKDQNIVQPALHFEASMTKAAGSFKIQGKRGASYKDLFKSSVIVSPDYIPHNVKVPDQLDMDADKNLYLDMRPVVISRARVVRIRPVFKRDWKLEFEIEVADDGIAPELLKDILEYAGRFCGVGELRPKFGRFMVTSFQVHKNGKE